MEIKMQIMTTKRIILKGSSVYIDNELTPINVSSRTSSEITSEEAKKGKKTKVYPNKLVCDDKCICWDPYSEV